LPANNPSLDSPLRYDRLTMSLHWLTAVLVEQVAWAIVIMAGLHALIALVHHYGLRDNTLRRLLPERV
jgi:cytochrome b561